MKGNKMLRSLWNYSYLRLCLFKAVVVICVFITTFYMFSNRFEHLYRHVADKRNNESRFFSPTDSNGIRVLCLILTSDLNHQRMLAVNNTWAKRCDHHLFVYGNNSKVVDDKFSLKTSVIEGRSHLTAKVRFALEYAYNSSNLAFDWILKCDDDTYVIMDNLKNLLSRIDPKMGSYLGFHMKTDVTKDAGYMSGGAGYVINSPALSNLVNIGFRKGGCKQDGGDEDVEIGLCLAKSNVTVINSVDTTGKETFHAENLKSLLSDRLKVNWLKSYSWNKTPFFGPDCCSKYSVSFHYVLPSDQYLFEHLLYNTEVYRGQKGDNSDNGNVDKVSYES